MSKLMFPERDNIKNWVNEFKANLHESNESNQIKVKLMFTIVPCLQIHGFWCSKSIFRKLKVTMRKREPTEVVLLLLCKSSNMLKQRKKENKLKLISNLIWTCPDSKMWEILPTLIQYLTHWKLIWMKEPVNYLKEDWEWQALVWFSMY